MQTAADAHGTRMSTADLDSSLDHHNSPHPPAAHRRYTMSSAPSPHICVLCAGPRAKYLSFKGRCWVNEPYATHCRPYPRRTSLGTRVRGLRIADLDNAGAFRPSLTIARCVVLCKVYHPMVSSAPLCQTSRLVMSRPVTNSSRCQAVTSRSYAELKDMCSSADRCFLSWHFHAPEPYTTLPWTHMRLNMLLSLFLLASLGPDHRPSIYRLQCMLSSSPTCDLFYSWTLLRGAILCRVS
ncbi:hypothetical protein C8Q80DRAFT_670519 [Daedaleopsis nitida]|nr:hypothetical protein C8Q80DRAFT_670519 [Daedaleopsis nitida]